MVLLVSFRRQFSLNACRVRQLCSSSSETQKRPLYFSGIQPTGVPHLGNYFGFIEPWIRLQKDLPSSTDMILSVVDQHAISLGPKPGNQLREDTHRMVAGLLACGVDPDRTLLFRQSDVPEISQLTLTLGSMQTVAKLQRLPQYKDKAAKFSKGEVPFLLMSYPLLQAADVMTFRATHVPVGEDQSQHMNLLADLAYRFNKEYDCDFFPIPKQITRKVNARVKSLRDPLKKMSKSDNSQRSRIDITKKLGHERNRKMHEHQGVDFDMFNLCYTKIIESREQIVEKCKKAVSDSQPTVTYKPDTRAGISNLIDLYCAMALCEPHEVVEKGWVTTELKTRLADVIDDRLAPVREEYDRLQNNSTVNDVIFEGGKRARKIASTNMEMIREIVGFR